MGIFRDTDGTFPPISHCWSTVRRKTQWFIGFLDSMQISTNLCQHKNIDYFCTSLSLIIEYMNSAKTFINTMELKGFLLFILENEQWKNSSYFFIHFWDFTYLITQFEDYPFSRNERLKWTYHRNTSSNRMPFINEINIQAIWTKFSGIKRNDL